MPSLLRDSARNRPAGETRCRSTSGGATMPSRPPSALIHRLRLLCRCAAIVRTVLRGAPGTGADQISGGRCSTRYIVTRLVVRQASIRLCAVPTSGFLLFTFRPPSCVLEVLEVAHDP